MRTKKVSVRFTLQELDEIQEAANITGLTVAAFLRTTALERIRSYGIDEAELLKKIHNAEKDLIKGRIRHFVSPDDLIGMKYGD